MTRASKVALAAVALPLLILGIAAVPSGRALAQPVPYRPATQAVVTAKLGTAVQFTATQLAAFHAFHLHHLAHMAHLRALAEAKAALVTTVSVTSHASSIAGDSEGAGDSDGGGAPAQAPNRLVSSPPSVPVTTHSSGCYDPSGHLSYAQVGMLWVCAGGPAWAQVAAENVSECESGHNTSAYNPSGATGLWQILGAVSGGSLYDAHVNAVNAVIKFKASGDTWAQWVCKP